MSYTPDDKSKKINSDIKDINTLLELYLAQNLSKNGMTVQEYVNSQNKQPVFQVTPVKGNPEYVVFHENTYLLSKINRRDMKAFFNLLGLKDADATLTTAYSPTKQAIKVKLSALHEALKEAVKPTDEQLSSSTKRKLK